MTVAATTIAGTKAFEGWRSPTPQETPLIENTSLPDPGTASTKIKANGHGSSQVNANGTGAGMKDVKPANGSDMLTDQHQQNQRLPNGKLNGTTPTPNPTSNGNGNGNGNLGDKGEGYKNLHPQLHYPSFQSPCELSADGDMHSHAVDLLSISAPRTTPPPIPRDIHPNHPLYRSPGSVPPGTVPTPGVAASVPTNTRSFLSDPRPTSAGQQNGSTTAAQGATPQSQSNLQAPRAARRMSSSTSQSRGKSGFLGTPQPAPAKDGRPAGLPHSISYNGATPTNTRRLSNAAAAGGAPQLYDFSKTDRPSQATPGSSAMGARTVSTPAGIAASLPVRGYLHERALAQQQQQSSGAEDMELDMQFGGSDDDDRAGSGRSGSQDIEMEVDEDTGEIITQALGTGSGGVKGRRKGETFDCEFCGKTYRHPSCLSKHRWEHSPHWQNGGAANMSKHQQVQTLEAAAILTMGLSLPKDKSLWPSVMSNSNSSNGGHSQRRNSRDPSSLRSPPSSVLAPITPSSLREPSSLGAMSERVGKERKSSPGSDSTTSSMGAGEPYPAPNGLGLRNTVGTQHNQNLHPGMNQRAPSFGHPRRASRTPSFSNSPGHPNSLPDMAGLHFHSSSGPGVSPIPNRGIPLSLQSRAGMIGGGMFGNAVNTSVRSSSVRSGVADLPEEDDDEEDDSDDVHVHGHGHGLGHRGKSSSEEAEEARKAREGEEWGMAEEMEL